MEQPVTNSALSLTVNPTHINKINEMSPAQGTMNSLSLPSTEIKQSQPAIIKSVNHRVRSPFRLHSSKQQPHTLQKDVDKLHRNDLNSKRRIVSSFFSQDRIKNALFIRPSLGDNRLEEIIEDLSENPVDKDVFGEEIPKEEKIPETSCSTSLRKSQRFIRHLMEQPKFHYTIIVLIIIDLIVVFVELTLAQLSLACITEEEMEQYNITEQRAECLLLPSHSLEIGELVLFYISLITICIFVLEILFAFYAFGWRRYKKILYLLDAFIIFSSFILEVYFHFGASTKAGRASAGLVVLRLWKIVRAIHAIAHSMSLRNHMIIEEIKSAREILQEEKLQAEKTIGEQAIKIDNLTTLLEKTGTQTTAEQINELTRRRTKSFNSVTFF